MTSERLKKIEEIYHAVLETAPPNRKEFLQEHCGGDIDLRLEIESLLSFEKTFASIIDSPPASLINGFFSEQKKPSLIGTQINQYKILSLLGEGGMGTVYLAQDTKLERQVAIKFLSDNFVKERSSLERFFREAKSSSALNHPNIITVHEIGEFENRPFIATEFIDGITLKEFLLQAKIPLTDLIDIAVQVVSALSTAHKAGIIHRDIKPDNVMSRRDGIVKVLDFGLAKISQTSKEIDPEANTQEKLSTIHGLIMGTPQFMSPEQARGKKVDNRTDIWSFGVLLYQMLTRKLPFQGETTSDIIASILKSEPPPLTQFWTDISPELEKITLKCLRKRRSERYQNIDELLSELKSFRRDLEFGTKTKPLNFRISEQIENEKDTDAKFARITAENSDIHSSKLSSIFSQTIGRAKTHPVSLGLIFITIISLLAAIGIGFSRLNLSVNQVDSFSKMKLAKVTFDGTATNITTVSPDGKYIVYALSDEGKQSLMLRQVAASSVIQLVPPAEVNYAGFTFTPDNNYIYYTVSKSDNVAELYELPVLGGIPRKIANDVGGKVTFSPDGKMMAFVRAEKSLMLADNKGGSQRILANYTEWETPVLAEWNPDGKTIMSSVFSSATSEFYLNEISINDGTEKRFSDLHWLNINGLAWLSDGSGIILAGRDPETKFSQVWSVSYPGGEPRRITNDFSTYLGLGLTADNKSLAVIKRERLYNIWTSVDKNSESTKKITVEEGRDEGTSGLAWTPDGRIVYSVNATRTTDLWIVNADGSGNRQLTFDQGLNFSPVVSPDGRYIVFTSTRTGNQEIWRMDLDGGNPVQLTETTDKENEASFTPDGKWIVYQRINADTLATIWKVNVDGGNPIQLTTTETDRPTVSPDGKVFACDYGDNPIKLAIFPIEGGTPLKILDLPLVINAKSRVFRWTPDSKALVYTDTRKRNYNLWSQTLDNSPPKQLTFFESGQIFRFDVARDGKGFAMSRGNDSSDVVMIGDFR